MVVLVLGLALVRAVHYLLAVAVGHHLALLVAVVALALLVPEDELLARPMLNGQVLVLEQPQVLYFSLHVLELPAETLDLAGVGPGD